MADTQTLIAALKFQGGVVIAADSQTSDIPLRVRWPVEKLDQVGHHPIVIGFSNSGGMGQRARTALEGATFQTTTFKNRERVQNLLDAKLGPIHQVIKTQSNPPPGTYWPEIGLTALTAFWAGNAPHILEREGNGDSYFHDCFHAIGSGGSTAYAVYNTLGGKQKLPQLNEAKALMAILRIVRTAIRVDVMGISEPINAFVVSSGKVRRLGDEEISAHMQAVREWELAEQERFRNMKI